MQPNTSPLDGNSDEPSNQSKDITLHSFWGARLFWFSIFAVAALIPWVVGANGGSIVNRIAVSAIILIPGVCINLNVWRQQLGLRAGDLVYTVYWRSIFPRQKKIGYSNIDRVLFGRLSQVAVEVEHLAWPLPNIPGGANPVKQFFFVLTKDHQTIAIGTSTYTKQQALRFMATAQANSIVIEVVGKL